MQTHATQQAAQPSKPPPFFSVQARREPAFFSPMDTVQRKCSACESSEDKLHRQAETSEEEPLQSKSEKTPVQPKLNITPPDDPQEHEADQVAERVMRMPDPAGADASVGTTGAGVDGVSRMSDSTSLEEQPVQRKCADCHIAPPTGEEQTEDKEPDLTKDDDKEAVNPKSEPGGPAAASDDLRSSLHSSRGKGQPLPAPLKTSMEGRFGEDFSAVRIHANSSSAAMAKSIHAQAFTYGSDIFLNPNRYDPGSTTGQTLLAHELTHVIQQKGTHPLKRKIQRSEEHDRIGNWAHEKIQEQLRSKDKQLITEAGIPGANRKGKKLNRAGFADLYKSEGSKMSGVQAEIHGAAGDAYNDVKYTYENFLAGGKRRANIKSGSDFHIGPRIGKDKAKTWDFTTNFPSTFEVGELKPLFPTEFTSSMAYHGTAPLQVDGYIGGFQEFVQQVHKDKGAPVPASISGKAIDIPESKIPDSINYAKFEQEHGKKDEHTILKNKFFKDSTPRVWIYQFKPGMFVYFLITHPYTKKEFPEQVDKQLKKLDPLLKALRDKHPKMGTALKREPGAPVRAASAHAISRKGGKRIQSKDDDTWTKAGDEWEKSRKKWAKGEDTATPKPKQFLKEQAKGVEKKSKVDKELKLTPGKAEKERAKQVKDIRFWSSWKGRLFGTLYFRFRKVFVKVEEMLEKVKARFRKHRDNATKLNEKGGIFDNWKKTATKAIIRIAVEIFKDMVGIAFARFMNCINAILDGIIDKYVKSIEAEVQEEAQKIEPLCCAIMDFKNQFDAEVAKHEKLITEFTDTVHKIQQWRQILGEVEIAVRVGVQVVSCGIPPGLGCLWGLVAQLGIDAGLALLTRCSYFDDYIAKPAAQALMDTIVGDKLHNLTIDVLEATPLKAHMAGLAACARVTKGGGGGSGSGIGGHLDKLDPNDPANAKARQEWEAQYKDEILKDLQEVFEKGDKTPLTEEEVKKLVETLKAANKTPEELKKMLQAARNPKTGKLDLTRAEAQVTSGEVPKDQPKDRKIAKNAQRQNAYYEQKIGSDILKFIKLPGIKADSQEFAEAVYDMQEAIGVHADGVAGPGTTVGFYKANNLAKDKPYNKAVEVGVEEQRARETKKELEETKKKVEELLKDEKVKAAMDAPFPSETEQQKDLNGLKWENLNDDNFVCAKINGRAVMAIKTDAGHRIGAYFNFVEREFNGENVPMIVKTSRFYALDEIANGEGLSYSTRDRDRNPGIGFTVFSAHAKDSFYDVGMSYFGQFVQFE